MTALTAQQLRDANGVIIAIQYYDAATDRYIAGSGPGGGSGAVTFTDQVVIAVSGTAVAFPSHPISNGVIVKSLASNNALRQTTSTSATLTNSVAGLSGATAGYILEPGEAAPYSASSSLSNANQIYVNGYAGDVFSIIGS